VSGRAFSSRLIDWLVAFKLEQTVCIAALVPDW
jgi:hypothetical protein